MTLTATTAHPGAELQLVSTLGDTDTVSSPLLPGFTLAAATLWVASLR